MRHTTQNKIRFRPYLKDDVVILFERVKQATGLSYERILMSFLSESDTYLEIKELMDSDECDDMEIAKAFWGLIGSVKSV